ncbi:zinc finger BED domain-containing protein RICESLEEPER [Trifolium repens]|nr:zinc finger BED domain-containing protein RICESLEEPER [Trifolium repens]
MAAEDIYSGSEQMDTNGDENVTQGSQSPIAATEVSQPPTADPQGSQPPTADPQGSQPPIVLDSAALPPQPSKKRKPNASGPRKTSPAWDHFTKLSEPEVADPTAACNYCGKRYLCDTKSHGTTNMLAHCKICTKNPNILSNDPNQRVLTLGPNGAGGLELGAANPVLSAMGKDMKLKYDKYWGELVSMNQLIYFGVILDPCFKVRYLEYVFPTMYNDQPDVAENLLTKIKGNLSKMYDWYATNHGQQNRVSPSSSVSVSVQQPTQLNKPNAFKSYLKEINSIGNKNELEKYLAEDNVDEDDNFNLLLWWKQNCARFPVLSRMARDVFATPVSTVASESAFSTGGRVLDTFRTSTTFGGVAGPSASTSSAGASSSQSRPPGCG